ncbi:MAG: condensation domain-containing protein [Candidatus Aminicenantes bacterium]|jgi:amino acid adenylation domain-containing protein
MYYQHSQKKAAAADRNTKERDYWLNQLAGELTKAVFYYDYKNIHANRSSKKSITFPLIGDIFVKLCQLSRNSHHALHMIFVALLTILLSRYTSLKDIIIGSPIYKQDIEGEFINTLLALRNRVEDNMSFKEFLVRVKGTVTEAVENQNYPIETLLFKLNMEFSSHDFPLFDVMVLVENVHDKKYIQQINPNVIFSFRQTAEEVAGVVEYNPALYDQTTIERIISHFTCLLQAVLTNLDLNLSSIPILSQNEKEQLIFELNDSKRAFVRDRCYPQLFEKQAAKGTHRTAAIHNHRHITYGELNGKSNQLAALLREKGVTPDHLVAVLCERSIEMLMGIMGVFKAGGAYIPFEIDSPLQRIKTILADSEAHVLLTTSTAVPQASTVLFYGVICNGTDVSDIVYLDRPGDSQWNSSLEQYQELFRTYKLAQLLTGDDDNDTCVDPLAIPREMILRYDDQMLTYNQCMAKMHQLRCFIAGKELFKNIHQGSALPLAAVILDNPLYLIVVLLALKSFHIPFTVISPPINREKKRELTNSLSISVIFSQSQFLDELDQLFWESRTLKNYIIVDQYDYKSSRKESDLRKVWDVAAGESSEAINDYRWNSIYTGSPFSIEEMNQYIANIRAKLEPHLSADTRILEVGCGHGLALFDLAPRVGYYYATDLTPVIIEKNRIRVQREGLDHVELKAVAASEIDTLEARDFDIFICSSVIHFFPNTIFLEEVIKGAIDLLKDEGIIYLDDILNLRKKQDLIHSRSEYRQMHPGNRVRLGDEDSDLYVDIDFFRYLQDKYPEIIQWESSRKLGTIENELTRFRYDMLIKIDKKKVLNRDKKSPLQELTPRKVRYTARDIEIYSHVPFPDTKPAQTDLKDAVRPMGNVLGRSHIARYSKENLPSVNKPLHLSYVIYTSGTTGSPKGVMIHHQGMLNHIEAKINDLAITASDVIAQTASACFDISVWQFLAGLLTGGSTFIIDKESVLDSAALLGIIQRGKITIWESVPSLMTAFLHLLEYKSEKEKKFNHLRWMILTGEALGTHLVKEWYSHYPGIKVLNAYGPTEAADDVTHFVVHDIPSADRVPATVPIGKPLQNTHIYILDKNLSLCPIGVRGEICAAGVGVGRGYWKDPDNTQRSFIPNPYVNEIGDPDYAILYKTGDIGYIREDGNIHCLGRLDHQVKIRGYRIEPAEIENRLLNHVEITEAVVMVRTMFKASEPVEGGQDSEQGNKYLCAYFAAKQGSPVSAAELREYLAGELPDYMVPSYFVRMEKLPLTANGKIDGKALPEPALEDGEEYIAPANAIEKKLVRIWADILALETNVISTNANFFEIGGHSLRATILTVKIHKELHVRVPLAEVFTDPTIKGLAAFINQAKAEKFVSIEPVEKQDYYPLSTAQEGLYITQQIDPESTAYNIPVVIELTEDYDGQNLESAFNRLIERHESLRTSFQMIDDKPVQRIHRDVEFEIEYYDSAGMQIGKEGTMGLDPLSPESTTDNRQPAANMIKKFIRSFDLSLTPLMRVGLVSLTRESHVLMVDMHHIISDGVSDGIISRDFMRLYRDDELPALRLQYKDYSQWLQKQKVKGILKKQEKYWLQQFKGDIPVLNLPTDYPRPAIQSFEGSTIIFEIGEEEALKQMAGTEEVTTFMMLLALFNIMLTKLSSQEDIVVGTDVTGRSHADLEDIIGMFVNMLPLRNFPAETKTFKDFLEEIKEKVLNSFDNQDYQFENLVDLVVKDKDASRNPIFDVVISLKEIRAEERIEPEDHEYIPQTAKFDLILHVLEAPKKLFLAFEYCTKLFKKETIEKFILYFKEIVSFVIKNPEARIWEIEMVGEAEEKRLLDTIKNNKRTGISEKMENSQVRSDALEAGFDF